MASERLLRDLRRTVATVLLRPTRLRRLVALGPRGLAKMTRFLGTVVPRASRELRAIRVRAAAIPDPELRAQALASIDGKAYHVQGGAILATFLPREAAERYIRAVAALETIYDYLDNLCDRIPGVSEHAFGALHDALLDALDPQRPLADYYREGPRGEDGGYLRSLVADVRREVAAMPQGAAVRPYLSQVALLYAELQTLKHLPAGAREAACGGWYADNRARFPGMYWWEFAAACGSSLPIFALLYLASRHEPLAPAQIETTLAAYFPNVSAVHILLDYFIDQAEDREHAELNFIACYASSTEAIARLRRFLTLTLERIRKGAESELHEFVLRAMCLFYLTHPKVFEQRLDRQSRALLRALR